MRIQTSQKAEQFARALRATVLGVFAVFVCVFLISLVSPHQTSAAASNTVNFQAKLETSAGAIVPDGSYNIEFQLFNVSSGGSALWTEDYLNSASEGVSVANGYLTVSLGSITPFPSTINWNQQLWLTMNIGATPGTSCTPFSSCSPNGAMSPRLLLTATPYSFQAGELAYTAGTYQQTLSFGSTPTATEAITLPDASGTVCLQGTSGCGFLTGSGAGVQLQSGSPPGTPQTGNFNVSGTGIAGTLQGSNYVLTAQLDTPVPEILNIANNNATAIDINQNTTLTPGKSLTVEGAVTFADNTTSVTAFQVQNTSGVDVLAVDATDQRLDIGFSAGSTPIGTPTGQLYVSGSVPTSAIGSVSTGSDPVGIYVQGSYAYMTNNGSSTLGIYNVSSPASPVAVGSVSTGSSPVGIYVSGRYAYVGNEGSNTLGIYDISNPASPVAVGSVSTGSSPRFVYVQGSYAYVTNNGSNTLGIYDISNPASPVAVGSVSTGASSTPDSVYVSGRYAYVANDGSNTLGIYDISNPASPVAVGSVSTGASSEPYSVYVSGHYAYVAEPGSNTLGIYDISNPTSPVAVGSVSTGASSEPYSVYVSGHYAYVTNNGSNTLGIYDISNPTSPVAVGSVSTGASSYPESVYVQGRYAYVDDSLGRLAIYDLGGSYIQQLQTGGLETGALQVDNNATINGDTAITGGLSVSQSGNFSGNLGVSGQVLLQNATNSATAFEIQNASGATVLATDTTANTVNLSGNLNFNQVAAPTTAPTVAVGATGSLTGTYYYVVTYVTASGQTNEGPQSASVTPSSQQVNLTAIPVSGNSLVTAVDIYRSTSLYGPFDYVGQVANGTTTFTDNDTSPGSAASQINQTTQIELNGSPILVASTSSIALGIGAMQDSVNGQPGQTGGDSVVGAYALQNSSGGDNSAFGLQALAFNSGSENNAVGYQALYDNTENYNNAVGYQALYDNTGSYNEALGNSTLNFASGSDNTSVGDSAQYFASSGSKNTAVGEGTLLFNSSGSEDTAVGVQALNSITSGSYNTALGYYAGYKDSGGNFVTGATIQNATAIGAYAQVQSSNSIVLGSVDTATKVGIGTTVPLNTFSVSPMIYNTGTACSVASSGSSTCSGTSTTFLFGTGTTWTAAMVGDELIFADGQEALISAVTSTTAITLSAGVNEATGSYYRIQTIGFQVTSGGNAYVQNTSTTAFQVQNNAGASAMTVDTTNLRVDIGTNGTPVGQLYVSGSVPTSAVNGSGLTTSSHPNSVYVQGNYAYSVGSSDTLQIIDVSNPTNPSVIDTLTIAGSAESVDVQGHYAYIAEYSGNELQIVDISNPDSPTIVSSLSIGANPYAIYVQGSYAFVVNQNANTLQIINVANPADPISIGSTTTSGSSHPISLYVQDRYAYVGLSNGDLQIFDVSNPTVAPVSVGTITLGASSDVMQGVTVSGRYAYVVDYTNDTLYTVDVSIPSAPVAVGSGFSTGASSNPYAVYVQGRYAYVVNYGTNTLQIINISSIGSPASVGTVTTGSNPETAFIEGRYAYVESHNGRVLQIFDLGGAYVQQLQTGSLETGSLEVDTNTIINGDASVQGGLSVGQSFQVNGNIGASGQVLLQNQTNSTTAFQVQNTAGNTVLGVNTSAAQVLLGTAGSSGLNGQLVFNTATSSNYSITLSASGSTTATYSLTLPTALATSGQCLQAGTVSGSTVPLTWGACGGSSSHPKKIVLTPEYAGAVLDNGGAVNDIGTMTSGFDSTQRESYYQWTTAQATNQVYDVVAQIPVPSDFSSWASSTPITVDIKTSDTTNGTVTAKLTDTTGTIETSWNTCSLTPGTTSWTTVTGCTVAGTYAANGVMTLRLILQAPTSGTTEIGNIILSYNSAY